MRKAVAFAAVGFGIAIVVALIGGQTETAGLTCPNGTEKLSLQQGDVCMPLSDASAAGLNQELHAPITYSVGEYTMTPGNSVGGVGPVCSAGGILVYSPGGFACYDPEALRKITTTTN